MYRKVFIVGIFIFFVSIILLRLRTPQNISQQPFPQTRTQQAESTVSATPLHPLAIPYMRTQIYSGSDLTIEETLSPSSTYTRHRVSYRSEGLKIFALLTIPTGEKPVGGWPVIVFNHGYIPPAEYRTTERYVAYTDAFSRNGYILIRPDYRGHGSSEGNPEGAYYSPAYTVDVLNALSSVRKLKDADPQRVGMWGHSMGGMVTLRAMVVDKGIRAGVIWAGVAVSYKDMAENWRRSRPWAPSQREREFLRPTRQDLINTYGDYDRNPQFWASIAPISFAGDISGPVQLHHGTADDEVPLLFSRTLDEALREKGKTVDLYVYEGDDHNLSGNLQAALTRSVAFFDKHVKNVR